MWTVKRRLLVIAVSLATVVVAVYGVSHLGSQGTHNAVTPELEVHQNIPYCATKNPYQTLDTYRPANDRQAPLPVVVYIHGGGWRSGSKHNALINYYAKFFASQGFATISVAYQLHTPDPYPDQNTDVACALSYIEDHAANLGVDPDKMILFGDSAGGDLATFASLVIPYEGYDYDAPRGVIDFYGVFDFSKIIVGSHPDYNARRYLGSKYNEVAVTASPVTYVTKKAPRFLLVHGTNDTVVPITQSQEFYRLLTTTGIDAEYVAVPGAHHGFIGPELGAHDNQVIQSALTSFLHEVLP